MSPIWQVTGLVSTALLLLSIRQLQRRSYFLPYPFLSLLLITQLLSTVAQWGQLMSLYSLSGPAYARLYWITEFTTEAVLIMVMISFIYRALEGTDGRWRTLVMVAFVVAASGAVTIIGGGAVTISSDRGSSILARNLSFGAALLNVFLWQSLLKNRRNDIQLLLLALGAGFWTTGRAIGQSLRLLSKTSQSTGDAIVVLTEILSLGIWLWALSRFRLTQPPEAPASSAQPTIPA